jgi:hypothetical protein
MKKILTSIFLMLALLAMTAGGAFAQETTEITGTVQSVEFQTNENGTTIVVITLLDGSSETQIVHISLETAESLGLVTVDPVSGEASYTEDALGTEVTIPADAVIPDAPIEPGEGEGDGKKQHPVGSAISEFFSSLFGVEYETIMDIHQDGVGFGVIAQALRMTMQLGGDTETFQAIIAAKQSGDYSGITLADGSTPENWGDVVKSLKKGGNVGSVMSNKAEKNEAIENTAEKSNNGKGSDKSKGKGNDKGKGSDNGKGNGKGKDK